MLLCDFCRAEVDELPVEFDVIAASHIEGDLPNGVRFVDSGIWGACTECHEAIERLDWEELTWRCVIGNMAHEPLCAATEARYQDLRRTLILLLRAVLDERFTL